MYNEDLMVLREEDLITNPTTRLPVCLCLDTSSSMDGQPINELNEGVKYFFDAIKSDEIARYSVEISVVTFDSVARKTLDFASIDRQQVPTFQAGGSTSMGEGVNLALNLLENRKKEYSEKGVDYYQPWLVLMTDGYPTDNIEKAVQRVKELQEKRKITVFAVAIGEEADKNTLRAFSTMKDNAVLRVKSAEYFKDFFEWLSQSVSVASQSVPGTGVSLPQTPSSLSIEL